MQAERYPGERRGLSLFLEELAPVVEVCLGRDSLLFHAIRRALIRGALDRLRHAKHLFNALPRPVRQELQAGIVARPEAAPKREHLLADMHDHEPRAFVCFETDIGGETRVDLHHELSAEVALKVMVRPGSLPSATANALRHLADTIEADRRLLSPRHWRGRRFLVEEKGEESGLG